MSDTETINDRDTRSKALDAFASVPTPTRNNSLVPQFGMPAERVFGAVDVAVQRDEARILQKLKTLAAAAGDDWYYRFAVKKKGGGQDWIEGPSIKLANDVARIYGNCDIDCRSQDLGDSWLFLARFTDFETGFTLTRPFQQRKNQQAIKTDNARALDIAYQIGASKAIRNVVVNALQTFSDFAFNEARNSLVDKIGRDIDRWRNRTIEGLNNIPVEISRVEAIIGRAAKEWLAPDVARIIAMMKAIADGMTTVDDSFPALDKQVHEETDADQKADDSRLNEFAGEGGAQAADTKKPEENKPDPEPEKSDGKKDDGKKEAATEQKVDQTEAPPKNETEWKTYALDWIESITNAEAGKARWAREKSIRNKANVSEEVREEVKSILDKKIAALAGQG